RRNEKDVREEVPEDVRSNLQIELVSDVAQVLKLALEPGKSRK
ncbi:MAG: hypothetical protein GX446_03040, partial [Chthonomonadales bacterium]|nr:hypothetical protein [Chthonomonadales bacterium]